MTSASTLLRRLLAPIRCADCGADATLPPGPPDGWQLEDGRTVCHACCVADTRRQVDALISSTTTDTP